MREIRRRTLFLLWLNWFQMALKQATEVQCQPCLPKEPQTDELCHTLSWSWDLPKDLMIDPADREELMKRLALAWTTLHHALEAGLQPPEQPLLPYRLRLLMMEWPSLCGSALDRALDEATPDAPVVSEQALPAELHTVLLQFWPRWRKGSSW